MSHDHLEFLLGFIKVLINSCCYDDSCSIDRKERSESIAVCKFFSSQHESVKDYFVQELKKEQPRLRLVFCSAVLGMRFDSPSVERIIHGKPPKRIVDFIQEVGRAGRKEFVGYYRYHCSSLLS